MSLFIFLTTFVVVLVTLIIIIHRKYKKELITQEWYEDFQFEYESIECPHDKIIKLKDTNWKFAFRTKKEKRFTVTVGGFSNMVHEIAYRFYCEECGKKRWFKQTNSIRHHKGLFGLRLKYLILGGAIVMLTLFISAYVLAWLFFR